MSKRIDKFVVGMCLCLIAACWLLATEKTAQAADYPGYGPGYSCFAFYNERCRDTGGLACYVMDESGGDCDYPLCIHCISNQVFPDHVCVTTPPYGDCEPIGGSFQCNGVYEHGNCAYNYYYEYCDCLYTFYDGVRCEDFAFLYYYC